jgi:hypothetical protein|tara:strand:- start:521 stop:739 length:219 start_codon:yes stop_codon:yes gene_type:complete
MVDAVASETLVPDDELKPRKFCLQVGLQPTMVLHPIRQPVTNNDDVVALLEKGLTPPARSAYRDRYRQHKSE